MRIESGGANPNNELYYYGARWYLPGLGLFTQPDTIVPDYKNPQSLNRYRYALNNPVAYVDPTGHIALAIVLVGLGIAVAAYGIYYYSTRHNGSSLSVDLNIGFHPENLPGVREYQAWQAIIQGTATAVAGSLFPSRGGKIPDPVRAYDIFMQRLRGFPEANGPYGGGSGGDWRWLFALLAVAGTTAAIKAASEGKNLDRILDEGWTASEQGGGATPPSPAQPLVTLDSILSWRQEYRNTHGFDPSGEEWANYAWSLVFLQLHGRGPSQEDWEKHYYDPNYFGD